MNVWLRGWCGRIRRSTRRFTHSLLYPFTLALLTGGCARLISSYDVAPNGLLRTDDELRRYLAFGHADSALLRLTRPAKKAQLPKDDLLRTLYEGVTAHYAGDFARSTAAFDRADLLADDRVTKSISRAALSLMVNDLSLAWEPSRTERLLIPYYAALSYLQAGRPLAAAVEARRLSHQLQTLADDGQAPAAPMHAFLRNFAGIVFEAAGEPADADVAYRNALALDSLRYARTARSDSLGEVVVVIEHGFVPHRVQESLIVVLADEETHDFDDDDEDRRRAGARRVADRVLEFANVAAPRTGPPRSRTLLVPPPPSKASESHPHQGEPCDSTSRGRKCDEEDEDHSYVLRMSWPVMYTHDTLMPVFQLQVDSMTVPPGVTADIGRSVYDDFRREQPMIVARTIARAAAKYALKRGIEKQAGEKDEGLGKLAGALANIGGAITEQADTRSWHFLPRSISVIRYALPPGTHHIRVDGGTGARVDLGRVEVAAGRLSVLSTRVWN